MFVHTRHRGKKSGPAPGTLLKTTYVTTVGPYSIPLDPLTKSYTLILNGAGGGGGGGNRTNTILAGRGGRGAGTTFSGQLSDPKPPTLDGIVGVGGNGGPAHTTVSLRTGGGGQPTTCSTLGLSSPAGSGGTGATTSAPGNNGYDAGSAVAGGTAGSFLTGGGKGGDGSATLYEYA